MPGLFPGRHSRHEFSARLRRHSGWVFAESGRPVQRHASAGRTHGRRHQPRRDSPSSTRAGCFIYQSPARWHHRSPTMNTYVDHAHAARTQPYLYLSSYGGQGYNMAELVNSLSSGRPATRRTGRHLYRRLSARAAGLFGAHHADRELAFVGALPRSLSAGKRVIDRHNGKHEYSIATHGTPIRIRLFHRVAMVSTVSVENTKPPVQKRLLFPISGSTSPSTAPASGTISRISHRERWRPNNRLARAAQAVVAGSEQLV